MKKRTISFETCEKIRKILKSTIVILVITMLLEWLFYIPGITDGLIEVVDGNSKTVLFWVILYAITLFQTTLPIPAVVGIDMFMVTLGLTKEGPMIFFNNYQSWLLLGVMLAAFITGIVADYFIGKIFGTKAVKWIAGSDEDYNKWNKIINSKGKWFYAATVLLPVFPDDILAMIAGASKMKFSFYLIVNIICRGVGLIASIMFYGTVLAPFCSEGNIPEVFGVPLIPLVYTLLLVIASIGYFVIKIIERKITEDK